MTVGSSWEHPIYSYNEMWELLSDNIGSAEAVLSGNEASVDAHVPAPANQRNHQFPTEWRVEHRNLRSMPV